MGDARAREQTALHHGDHTHRPADLAPRRSALTIRRATATRSGQSASLARRDFSFDRGLGWVQVVTAKSRTAAGMPLSSCSPRSSKVVPEPCDEIDDGPRHEHLTRLCGFTYATCEVDGDACELGATSFYFTGVDPDPDLEADLAGRVADGAPTTDGAGGAVEGSEGAVTGEFLLVAGEPRELMAQGVVVPVEHRAPGPVADGGDPVDGADDVGEQQGGEHPRVIGGDAGAGQELIDRSIQVHGALGYSTDTPLASMYQHARWARFADGADEVHQMRIAQRTIATYTDSGSTRTATGDLPL
jgi:Acyl-CoA dehydrogenase, C-terminal domain